VRRLSFVASVFVMLGAPAFAARRTARPAPTPSAPPAAPPTPAPTALPIEARVELLRAQLTEIGRSAPGRLGVAIVDTSHGARVSLRGNEPFPLASTYKLAIGLAAFRRADQRRLDLDERVIITAADLRADSAIAASHPHGGVSLTYWELLRAMLVDSDNTASDVVLRALGGPRAVQSVLDRLGIAGFRIRKSEGQIAAGARRGRTFVDGADNEGTPESVAAVLEGIAAHRLLLEDSTAEMLAMLAAHKTGTSHVFAGIADATNDAVVVTFPDGRRLVVVALLAASKADSATRDAVLARVASAAYDAFAP
jgi:beta-lactamase class A